MFGRGISEGLPPPLEPKPVPQLPMPLPRRPRAQILREFDNLREAQPAPRNIPAWYKKVVQEIQNIVVNGRGQQVIKWHYLSNLINSLAGQILDRIKWGLASLFRINYSYYNRLRKYWNQQKASMVGRRNENPVVSQSSRGPGLDWETRNRRVGKWNIHSAEHKICVCRLYVGPNQCTFGQPTAACWGRVFVRMALHQERFVCIGYF